MSKKPHFLKGWIKGGIYLFLNAIFWFFKKRFPIPTSAKRILICNTASFGDVVIATTVLPVLKQQYPNCEIGFLTASKTAEVLKNHPLVSFHHTIDHWFWNQEKGLFSSLFLYFIDFIRVKKEIKKCRYDLAIDLYPHVFLSAIPLLWSAKVFARAGHSVRGFSNLLTAVAFPQSPHEYMGQTHLNLLKNLGIDPSWANPLPVYTHHQQTLKLPPKSYIVVHMGTGYKLKEWNTQKWISVVQRLIEQGERVILTGKGDQEQMRCDFVASQTGCLNYCNQLNWAQFSSAIQQAKLLISVDSSAVHLASAVYLPCVVLFSGVSAMAIWKPIYPLCIALMKPIACAPCLSREGCHLMSCIQEIEPEKVIFHANRLLKPIFEKMPKAVFSPGKAPAVHYEDKRIPLIAAALQDPSVDIQELRLP